MMKKKYYFMGFVFFLFYACGACLDYENAGLEPDSPRPKAEKYFTIINHTNKEYNDNFIDAICPYKSKSDGKWKINYSHWKKKIGPKETVTKDDYGNILKDDYNCPDYESRISDEKLFLLSLNGGNRKIFFGAHDYQVRSETKQNRKTCTHDFVRWDIHPVWQEKKLTIHIYKDRIEFSDPKIKEAKKICLKNLYDDNFKIIGCEEEVDLNTLPLVDCNKVICGE